MERANVLLQELAEQNCCRNLTLPHSWVRDLDEANKTLKRMEDHLHENHKLTRKQLKKWSNLPAYSFSLLSDRRLVRISGPDSPRWVSTRPSTPDSFNDDVHNSTENDLSFLRPLNPVACEAFDATINEVKRNADAPLIISDDVVLLYYRSREVPFAVIAELLRHKTRFAPG